MTLTNNVTRFLDAHNVEFTAYEFAAEKLGAVWAAQLMGAPAEQVFKTIVTTRERRKPVLAVIPGPRTVDLKLLAVFLGEKKISLPTEHGAETLTGLQAGGISPLALIKKGFQVVIDTAAKEYCALDISGGQRGLSIRISVMDLAKLTKASFAPISESSSLIP